MNAWLMMLGGWLVDFACFATVLLVVAAAMRLVVHDAGGRVSVTWGTWLSLLAACILVALPGWPRYEVWRLIGPPALAMPVNEAVEKPVVQYTVAARSEVDAPVTATRAVIERPRVAIGWPSMVAAAWLTAAIVAAGWVVAGFCKARRLVLGSRPAPRWIVDEFRQIAAAERPAADVRISGRLSSPVALGTIWPRIVLPQGRGDEIYAAAIRAALAHEWAHIRHGDLWLLLLERTLLPLLALHPLFWWLRRQTRLDQELLADAAAAGDRPVEYAEALVALAKEASACPVGWAGLAMFERKNNLLRRVQMILSSKRSQAGFFGRLCAMTAVVLMMALGGTLSMITVRRLSASDEPAVQVAAKNAGGEAKPTVATELAGGIVVTELPDQGAAAEPPVERATNAEKKEYSITLQLTLWALDRGDFQETRKEVVGAVEKVAGRKLERPAEAPPRIGNQARVARSMELEANQAEELAKELRSLEGVKLVSRATIIALNWQEAKVSVVEPSAQVLFTQEVNGKVFERTGSQSVSYNVSVKPRIVKGNENRVEISIDASRARLNELSPTAAVTAAADVKKTLFVFGTEAFVILISPTKVERRAVTSQETIGPQFGEVPVVPALSNSLVGRSFAVPAVAAGSTFPAASNVIPTIPPAPASNPSLVPSNAPVYRPTIQAAPTTITAAAAPYVPAAVESRQTNRKLLELDLAEAKLSVESAEVELTELQAVRSKTPAAVSQQELRKRQLEVERAKIQVKRIEIQLEEQAKAGAATTPSPAKPT